MQTTVAIDDDVLAAVKEMASTEGRSIGEVLSSLARSALRPQEEGAKVRNGVPLLPLRSKTTRVASGLVKRLGEELR